MRIFWHATYYENLASILDNGLVPGIDGLVYMCETEYDAAKFLYVRQCKNILTMEIKIYKKDESKIIETFDHNERFFKCKAFGYKGNIPLKNIKQFRKIELD